MKNAIVELGESQPWMAMKLIIVSFKNFLKFCFFSVSVENSSHPFIDDIAEDSKSSNDHHQTHSQKKPLEKDHFWK